MPDYAPGYSSSALFFSHHRQARPSKRLIAAKVIFLFIFQAFIPAPDLYSGPSQFGNFYPTWSISDLNPAYGHYEFPYWRPTINYRYDQDEFWRKLVAGNAHLASQKPLYSESTQQFCDRMICQGPESLFEYNLIESKSKLPADLPGQQFMRVGRLGDYALQLAIEQKDGELLFQHARTFEPVDCFEAYPQEAVKWAEMAADFNHPPAQYYMAQYYTTISLFTDDKKTSPADSLKQFEWLSKAAEQGYGPAQLDLGLHFLDEATTNYQEAFRWLTEADQAGEYPASFLVAMMYYDGLGREVNLVEALVWIQKALNGTYPWVKCEGSYLGLENVILKDCG